MLKVLQPGVCLFQGGFVRGTGEDIQGRKESLDVGHGWLDDEVFGVGVVVGSRQEVIGMGPD